MISKAFTVKVGEINCLIDFETLKENWNDKCAVLKFGTVGTDLSPQYAVQQNFNDGVEELYSTFNVSEEDALRIVKELNLKIIYPPWDDGDPRRARKFVSQNSSDSWIR